VYIDNRSAPYVTGSEIDYVDNNMLEAGFAIKNQHRPPAAAAPRTF
jgi:Fe-S cluster assembly iron-binding protein IscA